MVRQIKIKIIYPWVASVTMPSFSFMRMAIPYRYSRIIIIAIFLFYTPFFIDDISRYIFYLFPRYAKYIAQRFKPVSVKIPSEMKIRFSINHSVYMPITVYFIIVVHFHYWHVTFANNL